MLSPLTDSLELTQLQAKYAYRSISEFVKHVTSHSAEHLESNPFPELHIPPVDIEDPPLSDKKRTFKRKSAKGNSIFTLFKTNLNDPKHQAGSGELEEKPSSSTSHRSDVALYRENEETAKEEARHGEVEASSDVNAATLPTNSHEEDVSGDDGKTKALNHENLGQRSTSGTSSEKVT